MKKTIFVFLLSIAAIFTSNAQETGIKFQHDSWSKIVQKARAEKKLIFMDAYTTWCGPCKMLQARVFPNKELGDYFNQNFVNAKIDMESGEGPALANQYPIQGYPSLFFIDPNTGKIVSQMLGYQEVGTLLNAGKAAVAKKGKKS